MLENSARDISIDSKSLTGLWEELDQDGNGSLSKNELISGESHLVKNDFTLGTKYFSEHFDDIANLENGLFENENEIDKNDVEILESLAFHTSLDAKYFDTAKNYVSNNSDTLDNDGNGYLSANEIDIYKSTHDVSSENQAALTYLKTRINGDYSNEFNSHPYEDEGSRYSSRFAQQLNLQELNSMSLEERISQSQRDIVSNSFISEWETGMTTAGKLIGSAAAGILGPMSGPGVIGAFAAGYIGGGLIGSAIGKEIGRYRGHNYYENTQRARLNRLLN